MLFFQYLHNNTTCRYYDSKGKMGSLPDGNLCLIVHIGYVFSFVPLLIASIAFPRFRRLLYDALTTCQNLICKVRCTFEKQGSKTLHKWHFNVRHCFQIILTWPEVEHILINAHNVILVLCNSPNNRVSCSATFQSTR